MRVMRSNLDGSNIETLVETGRGDDRRLDASRWCVGIALDVAGGKVYWTQKGGDNAGVGSIRRANLQMPRARRAHRSDIEVLFNGLPEPIDLDLDLTRARSTGPIAATAPRQHSQPRADGPAAGVTAARTDQQILLRDSRRRSASRSTCSPRGCT